MALYIPTTFGASGGGTIIASGSTSISGTIGMNGGWPFQQDYFVSNSITYSYWMWQGVDAYTGTTTNRNNNVATFDIFSGSTLNARLITIGGGGGAGGAIGTWTGTGYSGNECVGGGGAGGLVEFNNFPLIPGHYNIVAGAGGANGVQGIDSSITLPIPIAQPFTSSYVVAYSGGKGGANGAKGTSGGSVGGNTQAPGNPDPVISNPVLGAGLGGRSGGDQGRTSGEIPASTPTTEFRRTATGGGGFNASSRASSAGKYITDGGSGSLMQIYPYNYNTASYMVTGGGAAGLPGNPGNISQSFTFSQQGDNTWGIGSGGSVSGSGATTIWGGGDGNYGMVYLEYPYYFNPYPNLATDGLMFRLSGTSLTGSVWYDVSGNGNNALLSGSLLSAANNAFNFNGTNNYLTFPVSMSGYPVSQSFSLQWYGTKMNVGDAWYHWSGSGTLGRGDGYGDGWETYQTGSNKTLYTWVQTNFGGSGGGTVAWSRLYINDSIFWAEYDEIIPAISQPTSAPNVPWQFGYGTQLGTLYDPSRQFLSGSASDLLFYNRPLDVSEIANNYKYLQTLPIIPNDNAYRIAKCSTTTSEYINTTSSLSVNDVIVMSNYSSSYCYFVSESLGTNFNYPKAIISQSFADCSTCTGSLPPFPVSGLILWNSEYSLSGSIWYDRSGNANNGLVSGSTLVISGSLGYEFNGTNNYVTYPSTLVGQPSSSWTMQWYGTMYNDSVSRDLFCKDVYTDGWDTIWGSSTNDLIFRDRAGFDKTKVITNVSAEKTLWTMVCNDSTDAVRVYKNNTDLGNMSANQVNAFNASSSPLKFGFNANGDATYFKGTITNLLLYNKALNSTEVSQSYAYLSVR